MKYIVLPQTEHIVLLQREQATLHTIHVEKMCAMVLSVAHSCFNSIMCLVKHTIPIIQSYALSRVIAHELPSETMCHV